jgi:hypothetical protein
MSRVGTLRRSVFRAQANTDLKGPKVSIALDVVMGPPPGERCAVAVRIEWGAMLIQA